MKSTVKMGLLAIVGVLFAVLLVPAYLYFTGFCFEKQRYLTEAEFCYLLKKELNKPVQGTDHGKTVADTILRCYRRKDFGGLVAIVLVQDSKLLPPGTYSPEPTVFFTHCGKMVNVH